MIHRVLSYYREAMRNYLLPPPELADLQARKLRHIINHAYRNIPLYRRWFRSRGLTSEDIRTPEDLRRLPTLSREEIQENYPTGIVDPSRNARRATVRRTSGTTGRPLKALWDNRYLDVIVAVRWRRSRMAGIRPWEKGAEVVYEPEAPGSRGGWRGARAWPGLLKIYGLALGSTPSSLPHPRTARFRLGNEDLGLVARALLRFGPAAIFCRPSYLRRLAYEFRKAGPQLKARTLITAGEFLSRGTREELAAEYQAEVFDAYGSHEVGPVASECAAHVGVHLHSDFFVFEVLRDGEPVSPGEPGEMVVTSLHNELMPLIRYRQGDIVVQEEAGLCRCGSNLPRLRVIEGRLNDGLVSKDGIRIPPGSVIDHLETVIGLRDYQLIQHDRSHAALKVGTAHDTPQTRGAVEEYLRLLLGEETRVAVEPWREGEIPVKYRPVVSHVNV